MPGLVGKIRLLTITMLFMFYFFRVGCLAAEQSFDEYVRQQAGKEIVEESRDIDTESETTSVNYARLLGNIVTVAAAAGGFFYLYFTIKKYGSPHYINEEIEFDREAAAVFLDNLAPLDASAIINLNNYTIYDIITVIFDLIRRGFVYVEEYVAETRICIDIEILSKNRHKLRNYEDFLLSWLFIKVGENQHYNSAKLEKYLSVDSRAAQFDIDYDIWLDELKEHTAQKNTDQETEKWKLHCAIISIGYAVLGIGLLYVTNSTWALLMFFLTFLFHRLTKDIARRSKEAELDFHRLMLCKSYMERAFEDGAETSEREIWRKYFVFSIPFANTSFILPKIGDYEKLYKHLEEDLTKAVAKANRVVHSLDE